MRYLLGFCICISSLIAPLNAAEKPKLEWCLDHLPPRQFYLQGAQPTGPMVDMMQQLADRAGFVLTFSPPTPVPRCLMLLKQGKTDLAVGLLSTAARAQYLKLWPFDQAIAAALFIPKPTAEQALPSKLNGMKIILTKDRSYPKSVTDYLRKQPVFTMWANDLEAGLAMLMYGEADGLLGPLHFTLHQISLNPRLQHSLMLSPWQLPASVQSISHLGFAKKSAHFALAQQIEQSLQALVQEHKTSFYPPALTEADNNCDKETNAISCG